MCGLANCKQLGRSLMYVKNNNRPKIDPMRNLTCHSLGFRNTVVQNTMLLPSDKYDLNQLIATPVILYSSTSFLSNIAWETVSKALARSKNTAEMIVQDFTDVVGSSD